MRNSFSWSNKGVCLSHLVRIGWLLCAFAILGTCTTALRAQDARTVTQQLQARIASSPEIPAAGAQRPDVTIIEFLDYNCPYCKRAAPELQKLLGVDRGVQILYKEWPIFGDASRYAARSALAANWQGKFLVAHKALIGAPHDLDNMSQVDSVLKSAGVDLKQLGIDRARHSAEIDRTLARNAAEARELGLRGTPGFLINRQLLPRSLTLPQLQQLTDSARAAP